MEVLLGIIFIVFGVLQIILFFRIWGMTNNVSELTETFCETPDSFPGQAHPFHTISKYMTLGQNDKAIKFLNDLLDTRQNEIVISFINKTLTVEQCQVRWERTLAYYKRVYGKVGTEIPQDYENFDFAKYQDNLLCLRSK